MGPPNRTAGLAMPAVILTFCGLAIAAAASGRVLHLKLRTRVETVKGSGQWQPAALDETLDTSATAMILCDIWDNHWCQGSARRVDLLAPKTAPVVNLARERGILIIHAPSDTMDYYKTAPQRLNILAMPAADPPKALAISDPPLPIDDSDGGCDTTPNPLPVNFRAWSREHPAISIAPGDLVSDNGREVYNALHLRGIHTLLVAGVHANMCILNRSFAIRQMTKWGIRCILIRDLTDTMYNPARRPFVSHEQGTELVIEHIEKYWAPTVTSDELLRALR